MRLQVFTAIVAGAGGLAGCAETAPEPTSVDFPLPEGAVQFETIEQGDDSGYTRGADPQELIEPTLFLISDAATWNTFWIRHTQLSSPAPAVPLIDFSKQTVVAIVDHRHPSAATLEIVDIVATTGILTVRAYRACMPWTIPAWPFHIVRIDRHGWKSGILERTDLNGGNECSDQW